MMLNSDTSEKKDCGGRRGMTTIFNVDTDHGHDL